MTPSGVPLRDLMEARVTAVENTLTATAVALERRLEGMNEFRGAIEDQRRGLESRLQECLPRAEYLIQQRVVNDSLSELREWRAEIHGKVGMGWLILTLAISIIALLIGATGLLIQSKKEARRDTSNQEGQYSRTVDDLRQRLDDWNRRHPNSADGDRTLP